MVIRKINDPVVVRYALARMEGIYKITPSVRFPSKIQFIIKN